MRSSILLSSGIVFLSSQNSIMHVGAFQAASKRAFRPSFRTITTSSQSKRCFFHSNSALCAAAKNENDANASDPKKLNTPKFKSNKPKPKPKSQKIVLRDPKDFDLAALTAAFDKMAKKEGFDGSTALYADDKSFEDDFKFDPDGNDDFEFEDDDDEDEDDDFLDFGGGDVEESMEDRIKAAQTDMDLGRVSVPNKLDKFSKEVSAADLQKLGFKPEANPFGDDETTRKEAFKLISDAMKCSGCGAKFQKNNEMKPGFLPDQKFEVQVQLSKLEDAQNLQDKADSDEWTPEDEVEWLVKTGGVISPDDDAEIDIGAMAEDMGLDLVALTKKKVICKRCHGLQNFGDAPEMLRPGWTDEPMLSQEKFRALLMPLREKPAVIIALVDLFDFSGSILPDLDAIAGEENPVLIAANKADLLPSKMGQTRAESWVRRELEYLGVRSIANVGGAVRLVSCKTGFGISQLLAKARDIADDMECDIYVVGAANAGKSTLINHILAKNEEKRDAPRGKKRAGNANQNKGSVTASPLPGTTLEFIKIDLGNGLNLYDTPGLLVKGTLTQRLTPAELKMVVPKK